MFLTDPRIRAAYAEGAGIYRIIPSAVAIPASTADVVSIIRQAVDKRLRLIPRGAGSGMPGGNVGHDVVVDMSAGFAELSIDPERRIARAGTSVTWAAVNDAAKSHGLRLPPDPSSGAFATSGGMVSTNAAGPRTVRYGSVRGWVEGLEVVEADGSARSIQRGQGTSKFSLTTDGRRLIADRFPTTRKNSSGYALDRFAESGDELDLFVGAEGTLGI
ncbi:MAG TPA: FAD-binding oxidoreductase, partial [Gemmatimonadales bacterium]|nr:FAD-binding oxidoreductase [Gemmatimonadales bacterium]